MNLAALLCTSTVVGCLWLATPSSSPPALVVQDPPHHELSGQVLEWWAVAPGHLQFRIRGSNPDGKGEELWFRTPADKDMNTLFENEALDLIHFAVAQKRDLTVQSRRSSSDDGSTPDKACRVVRIGLR